ncbi:hypothetical protein WA158_008545 [Blastocystis sp. Blastoise]
MRIPRIVTANIEALNLNYIAFVAIDIIQFIGVLILTLPIGAVLRSKYMAFLNKAVPINWVTLIGSVGYIIYNIYKMSSASHAYNLTELDHRRNASKDYKHLIRKIVKYQRNIAINVLSVLLSYLLLCLPSLLSQYQAYREASKEHISPKHTEESVESHEEKTSEEKKND